MKVYIAGGWFDLLQLLVVKDIETILGLTDTEFFSPRLDNKGTSGMSDDKWDDIYSTNIRELHNCDIVISSTEGKDMGTLFECGYATAINKPVVYYAPNLKGPFNLMLAKSAWAVLTSPGDLHTFIEEGMPKIPYTGKEIE